MSRRGCAFFMNAIFLASPLDSAAATLGFPLAANNRVCWFATATTGRRHEPRAAENISRFLDRCDADREIDPTPSLPLGSHNAITPRLYSQVPHQG